MFCKAEGLITFDSVLSENIVGEFSRISTKAESYTRQEQTRIKILFGVNKKQKGSLTLVR